MIQLVLWTALSVGSVADVPLRFDPPNARPAPRSRLFLLDAQAGAASDNPLLTADEQLSWYRAERGTWSLGMGLLGGLIGAIGGGVGSYLLCMQLLSGVPDPILGLVVPLLAIPAGAAAGAVLLAISGVVLTNILYPPFVEGARPRRSMDRALWNGISVGLSAVVVSIVSIEYERRLNSSFTVFGSPVVRRFRDPGGFDSNGVVAWLPRNEGSVALQAGGRYYFFRDAPRGLFAQLHAETTYREWREFDHPGGFQLYGQNLIPGFGALLGGSLVLFDLVNLSLGAGATGLINIASEHSTDPLDPLPRRSITSYVWPALRANAGVSF